MQTFLFREYELKLFSFFYYANLIRFEKKFTETRRVINDNENNLLGLWELYFTVLSIFRAVISFTIVI